MLCSAARTATRGASGVTGSSPICRSTISEASQRADTSTPASRPSPSSVPASASPGHAVERQREREDGAGDEVGARPDGLEPGGERAAGRALAVDPDREPGRVAERADELLDAVRVERARRIVQQHARGADLREPLAALDQRLELAGVAGAVDEAGVELAAGVGDRLARLDEVRDVVERVVEPEDVDAVLGRGRDETADEVAADRPRADEEAAAERERQRGLDRRLERADPLPRALDAAAHGRVEHAAARDLEIGEAGAVEDLRERDELGGRHPARERLLPEQADRRVDELRH